MRVDGHPFPLCPSFSFLFFSRFSILALVGSCIFCTTEVNIGEFFPFYFFFLLLFFNPTLLYFTFMVEKQKSKMNEGFFLLLLFSLGDTWIQVQP